MPASFIFRIDEVRDDERAPPATAHHDGTKLMPSIPSVQVAGGVSGQYWYCNGRSFQRLSQLPEDKQLYKQFSMFYIAGYGYLVYRGDASVKPTPDEWRSWQRLWFDHVGNSSFLTDAAEHYHVKYTRRDQAWAGMLLPDIYHGELTNNPQKGALIGELAILLGLLAFSMRPEQMNEVLPYMMQESKLRVHTAPHGRDDRRGVVVYIYTSASWHCTASSIKAWEEGVGGACYYR